MLPALARNTHRSLAAAATKAAATTGARALSSTAVRGDAFSSHNATFLEGQYEEWRKDPTSVDPSLHAAFVSRIEGEIGASASAAGVAGGASDAEMADHLRVLSLIRGHRVRAHAWSNLDPLGLAPTKVNDSIGREEYNLTDSDMDREFLTEDRLFHGGEDDKKFSRHTLRDIVGRLDTVYGSHIGVEYYHSRDKDVRKWVKSQFEDVKYPLTMNKDESLEALKCLTRAVGFEDGLHRPFTYEKRFGLDGSESSLYALEQVLSESVGSHGVDSVVMGMPHRGRLSVLCNTLKKPYEDMFFEYVKEMKGKGVVEPTLSGLEATGGDGGDNYGTGDVKYHLGGCVEREIAGKQVPVWLENNPSHLEAVNPVVLGRVRARQDTLSEGKDTASVLPILMHGDAAFAGQGSVQEVLAMTNLPNYSTDGTIHIIVNNQIGFTTDPQFSRSTAYCTDVAKSVGAPIFHVNGEDIEAVRHVAKVAAAFRAKFKTDVVIDVVGFRKNGHNESDLAVVTQPKMYNAIKKKKSVDKVYANKLIADGIITQEEAAAIRKTQDDTMKAALAESETMTKPKVELMTETPEWGEMREGVASPTSVPMEDLKTLGAALTDLGRAGADFKPHTTVKKMYQKRAAAYESGEGLTMPMAEALAFGSLLSEGKGVRISGQDVERGTFAQRHAVLVDQNPKSFEGVQGTSRSVYVPLKQVEGERPLTISNSHLSECGVLGFEYGYSLEHPDNLVMWEAQFGDFSNGAQVITDCFVAAGEGKWGVQSGLTMLLPHGFDHQGPEHSSARPERFLQLSDDDPEKFLTESDERHANIQVAYASTPASYFHLLRRQMSREFKKPLVVMTSKSLLQSNKATSTMAELAEGTSYQRVIDDPVHEDGTEGVKRVVLCAGQVYHKMDEKREEVGLDATSETALVRVEQIAPFPHTDVAKILERYPGAEEVVWAQEEPRNSGCWSYVNERLPTTLASIDKNALRPKFVGRPPASAPALGSKTVDKALTDRVVNLALNLKA